MYMYIEVRALVRLELIAILAMEGCMHCQQHITSTDGPSSIY